MSARLIDQSNRFGQDDSASLCPTASLSSLPFTSVIATMMASGQITSRLIEIRRRRGMAVAPGKILLDDSFEREARKRRESTLRTYDLRAEVEF